jgi:hypothetical protein
MMVASLDGNRIEASIAVRGLEYRCPKCAGVVTLKQGRRVIAHFAHKPPRLCSWAAGETRAHLEAKSLVKAALTERGLRAEVEFEISSLPGDRRADVMTWSPTGLAIAFELQHSAISVNEIEARALSYAHAGVAQIWIPFLRASVWDDGVHREGGWFVQRYSAPPFERWVHGFSQKHGMWMYDPAKKEFWLGRLAGHQVYVPETTYYSEGGEENYGGGFHRWSKRYRELSLEGPHQIDRLMIKTTSRKAFATKDYSWPTGLLAFLTPG